jgi:hypothetical protein
MPPAVDQRSAMGAVARGLADHPARENLYVMEITGQALNLSQLTDSCTHAPNDTATILIVALHLCNLLLLEYSFGGKLSSAWITESKRGF